MINLFKIIGYNLTYSGPNVINASPYEINSSISQYEEAILEVTVDKNTIPGPVTVSVNFVLPNGNEYENVYMSGDIEQPNKYRIRLNDVIGNELAVGETNTVATTFKVKTETDVLITTTDVKFDLYKTNLDISYHPTDIDSLFIGLNKLSMGLANVDSTVQNYVDIANEYTDEKVNELKDIVESKVDTLDIYTRSESDEKFETKEDHESGITNLKTQIEGRYETKEDANEKLAEAKRYADDLLGSIGEDTGSVEGDRILSQAKVYTDNKIYNLVGAAPEELDTLRELADAIKENENVFDALETTVGNKANKDDVYTKTESDTKYVTKEAGKGLSTNDYTSVEKSKLSSLVNYDDTSVRNRITALESKDTVNHSEVYTKTEADNKFSLQTDLVITNNKFSNYYTKTETSTLLNQKQERLVSGNNIKTINGVSLLGSGNLVLEGGGSVDLTGYATEDYVQRKIEEVTELDSDTLQSIRELSEELSTNQEAVDALNNAIALKANKTDVYTKSETDSLLNNKVDVGSVYTKSETSDLLSAKQNVLISGQSIKTLNGVSILGEGNIEATDENKVNELIDSKISGLNISNYYTKSEIDEGFVDNDDIKNYAKISYVDDAISNLLGAAPETLDTIQELATAITNNDLDISNLNSLVSNTYTKAEVDEAISNIDVSGELENYYTKSEVDTAISNVDVTDQLTEYAKESWVEDKGYLKTSDATLIFATKSEVPTKVSQLENDKNYLTTHQDISGKQDKLVSGTNIRTINGNSLLGSGDLSVITDISHLETKTDANVKLSNAKEYTDSKVSNILSDAKLYTDNKVSTALNTAKSYAESEADDALLNAKKYTDSEIDKVETTITNIIDGAPAAYNTLKEIADYIESDKTGASEMLASINTNKTNIASLTTDLEDEVNTRELALRNIRTDLTTEINERKAADTQLQTNITTEISDRKAADSALETRITTNASNIEKKVLFKNWTV